MRYNAQQIDFEHELLDKWGREGRLIPVCPEVEGGLSIPRSPAELMKGDGEAVLEGRTRILNLDGADITPAFLRGAKKALQLALENHIRVAVLKERSPSCGVHHIYDGRFNGVTKNGSGVTTAILRKNGIMVFNENELEAVERIITEAEKEE
ncbi:MAG: DUF523 domain-containing protein [Calditrichia bacterium]